MTKQQAFTNQVLDILKEQSIDYNNNILLTELIDIMHMIQDKEWS